MDNPETEIFNLWNACSKNGRWRTHRRVTPDIERIVKTQLRRWTVTDICGAITNFAKIVQGQEFKWTYRKWGLYEFLSRRDKMNRDEYQWRRFHPNNFFEDDWLTKEAVRDRIRYGRSEMRGRIKKAKIYNDYAGWIKDAPLEVLNRVIKTKIHAGLRVQSEVIDLINKLRPETAESIRKVHRG